MAPTLAISEVNGRANTMAEATPAEKDATGDGAAAPIPVTPVNPPSPSNVRPKPAPCAAQSSQTSPAIFAINTTTRSPIPSTDRFASSPAE